MGHPNVQIQNAGKPVGSSNPLPVNFAAPAPSVANKTTFLRGALLPASAGTPEPLAAAGTYVNSVTIYAKKAARVVNAAPIWVDSIATNDAQMMELPPGYLITFTAPPGKVIDLADIYVDIGTGGDGVMYVGLL